MRPNEDRDEHQDVARPRKKPYATPRLIVHGDVEKITAGSPAGTKESLTSLL
jgi:hypothetical protein